MLAFRVTAQTEQVLRLLSQLEDRIVPRVAVRATNFAARRARTDLGRALAKDVDVAVRAVSKRTKLRRASRTRPRAVISIPVSPIPAGKAGALRQTRRGARVRGHHWPDGWVATINKGRTAFEREGGARGPVDALNIPIEAAIDRLAPGIVETEGRRAFAAEFERLAKVEIDKVNR